MVSSMMELPYAARRLLLKLELELMWVRACTRRSGFLKLSFRRAAKADSSWENLTHTLAWNLVSIVAKE